MLSCRLESLTDVRARNSLSQSKRIMHGHFYDQDPVFYHSIPPCYSTSLAMLHIDISEPFLCDMSIPAPEHERPSSLDFAASPEY